MILKVENAEGVVPHSQVVFIRRVPALLYPAPRPGRLARARENCPVTPQLFPPENMWQFLLP